ncbi:hypothetical protein BCR37DRAFT_230227 [Protomyces lactucae-debilis]|uniref:Uncharacterized protein n=1 Tax=Protomyces lactucae-debilis TaxID=2754530 RepID=A0A1Y2EQ45_PROLT|nr:uncharacterized protein BCR37DRAFT_230227 [Protomyces lactucae-debilis]ORY73658.1 hypothetical protein BCR37DRAFT_230227 [Protomyces lactucae-debilis]
MRLSEPDCRKRWPSTNRQLACRVQCLVAVLYRIFGSMHIAHFVKHILCWRRRWVSNGCCRPCSNAEHHYCLLGIVCCIHQHSRLIQHILRRMRVPQRSCRWLVRWLLLRLFGREPVRSSKADLSSWLLLRLFGREPTL